MKQDIAEIAEALEVAGDWAAFSRWTAERYEMYGGERQEGWVRVDGVIHLPTLAHLLAHSHPEKPPSAGICHSEVNKDRNAKEERPNR